MAPILPRSVGILGEALLRPRRADLGPSLDPLRAEPRFQAVLQRMNFPD